MANIRDLKKDVNNLTYEIIADCYTFMEINPNKKDEVVKIIGQALSKRNEIIQKINNRDNVSKNYFSNLRHDLLINANEILENLRKLLK